MLLPLARHSTGDVRPDWTTAHSAALGQLVSVFRRADAETRVNTEWWRLSAGNGTLGSDGSVLLSLGELGGMTWLRVRMGTTLARAAALRLPGEPPEFLALPQMAGRAHVSAAKNRKRGSSPTLFPMSVAGLEPN